MPQKATIERAKRKLRRGEAPSTAAGEFVREEMHHIRHGRHGARSPEQAIAIGLSKARRAGVPLQPPEPGTTSRRTRHAAQRAYRAGQSHPRRKPSRRRSTAIVDVLRREPRRSASRKALSRHAHRAASRRAAARKGARTRTRSRRRNSR
ncbi:MAG: transcription elongation factor [Kofleriaceae bacterium]